MIDLRPVVYVIGLVVAFLGVTMLVPMVVDLVYGSPDWLVFLTTAAISIVVGGSLSLATAIRTEAGLTIQQTFLLTTLIWIALPLFGSLPFLMGELDARPVDAFFEAMSGFTTTGSTVFAGLDDLPEGLLLWRSMLQWFGGVGIIVVAMAFLPELRVGGMQIFRSEAFDTMGKVLPRAVDIAWRITFVYLVLTALNVIAYLAVGMGPFDAVNHAFTTISTGGFSTHDASMGYYQGAPEYVASAFMMLGSLPFVRYIQFVQGTARPLFFDPQVRAYLGVILVVTLTMTFYRLVFNGDRADIKRPADLDGKTYAGFGSAWENALISSIIRHDGGEGRFDTVTLGHVCGVGRSSHITGSSRQSAPSTWWWIVRLYSSPSG